MATSSATYHVPRTPAAAVDSVDAQRHAIGMLHSRCLYDFLDPASSAYTIKDVAWGLSRLARFSGQTKSFFVYTVAQHSVLVSHQMPPGEELDGLLHDGHEFACGDVVSPLKSLLPDYQRLEHKLATEFRLRFGVAVADLPSVKRADRVLLRTEMRDQTNRTELLYPELESLPETIVAWPAWYARYRFLRRYDTLVKARCQHREACA